MIWAIHGFSGGPSSFRRIQEIPSSQCLTVLGHGRTSIAKGDETFASEVSRLSALLPSSCSHLVDYGLGARLALAIALQDPQRFSRLTLIGVHPGLASKAERSDRIRSDLRWSEMLRSHGVERFVDAWQALPLWTSQQGLSQDILEEQRSLRLAHDPAQLALALDALGTGHMKPTWLDLSTLTMTVEIVVGSLDSKYLALSKKMIGLLPKGQMRVVADAGHNPILENPEAVSAILGAATQEARGAQ